MTAGEMQVQDAVLAHIKHRWQDRELEAFRWELGSIQRDMPHFRVVRIPPKEDGSNWVYVTAGSWFGSRSEGHGHEFLLHSPVEEPLHVELLAQLAHYNADTDHRLRVGHTVPIGRPWLDDSAADHVVLAPPHSYPESFEYLTCGDFTVHFLWVLPVTPQEVVFRHDNGFEALEDLFESSQTDLTDPHRVSLVS